MLFEYHARNYSGIAKDGEIEAQSQDEAVKKLHDQGIIVISCNAIDSLSERKTFIGRFKRNLLSIKGLLFQVNCSKCKKQLKRVSIKKILDNKFICNSCFEGAKVENKKIIGELIERYLSNKDGGFRYNIKILFETISTVGLEPYSLDKAREGIRSRLANLKIRKKTENIDEIIGLKNTFESWMIFLDDLEKLQKLLKNKEIEVDYLTILAMFIEFLYSAYNKDVENTAINMYNVITKSFEKNISKEMVIVLCIKSGWKFDSDFWFDVLYKLLDKLNLSYTKEEMANLIKETKERIELEEFEQGLGSQTKIDIGDFKNLNGHEFEGYIQKLFELLGYTVVRTPLTGDQGADLIISKDGVKTVVQAKKYEGSVSNKAIQEVVAAKNYYKAEKVMVVTNSSFTNGAVDLALVNNVELWDGEKLENIMKSLEPKKEQVYEQTIACKSEEDKKTITLDCPLCKRSFEYAMDLEELKKSQINEAVSFKIICPHCGVNIKAETQKTKIISWSCQYCSQKFDTKEEAERHEKQCKCRDISNPGL